MEFTLLDPCEQLVRIMSRIYHNGMTTLSGGNLSIRDDNGDIWITPAGVDKGNLTANDISCIRATGTFEGPHKPSSEYPFHQAIYAQRPDLKAIVHAHPPALVSFSIARQIPDMAILPHVQRVCGTIGYAPYALTGSRQLGDVIAGTFAQGYHAVLLENHGVVTGDATLLDAFQRFETLEFGARTLLKARSLGPLSMPTDEKLDKSFDPLPEFVPNEHSSRERELRQSLVDIVRRAYQRQLMISTRGTTSVRMDDTSFLITPTGTDRAHVEIEDIVLIRDGRCEQGKQPSRSVRLHQAIYERHPQIQAIMTAQPPHATAFAISTEIFDTKTIPESYIMLRTMPVIPYHAEPDQIAAHVSESTPVVLLRHDGILTAGRSLLQAFDRLEVAEFSARSLIETRSIGQLIPMGEDDIRALEIAFNLS